MFWFAIGCVISGLAVGMVLRIPAAVALTSLQLILVVIGLVLSGELSAMPALLWALSGLFCHQGAYLAAVILRVGLEDKAASSERPVSAGIEEDLSEVDTLASRIASEAPQLRSEAANLAMIAAQLRRTLENREQLEALLVERRRASR